MKQLFSPMLLVLALSGCATVPSSLSPAGAIVFKANEGVVAIGTVQHAALALNAVVDCGGTVVISPCQKALSDANTRVVVDASTAALTTIKAVPEGWKATALTAAHTIEQKLDQAGKAELSAYLKALETIAGQ